MTQNLNPPQDVCLQDQNTERAEVSQKNNFDIRLTCYSEDYLISQFTHSSLCPLR